MNEETRVAGSTVKLIGLEHIGPPDRPGNPEWKARAEERARRVKEAWAGRTPCYSCAQMHVLCGEEEYFPKHPFEGIQEGVYRYEERGYAWMKCPLHLINACREDPLEKRPALDPAQFGMSPEDVERYTAIYDADGRFEQ